MIALARSSSFDKNAVRRFCSPLWAVMDFSDHQSLVVKRWAEDARYEVRLFGSRSRGGASESSEVDLAITVGGSTASSVVANYRSMSRRWQDELTTLLWMQVRVALYNNPDNDVVRQSCDQHSVLLFPWRGRKGAPSAGRPLCKSRNRCEFITRGLSYA